MRASLTKSRIVGESWRNSDLNKAACRDRLKWFEFENQFRNQSIIGFRESSVSQHVVHTRNNLISRVIARCYYIKQEQQIELRTTLHGGVRINNVSTIIDDGCKCRSDVLGHKSRLCLISIDPNFKSCCSTSSIGVSRGDNDADFLDEFLGLEIGNEDLIRVANDRVLDNDNFIGFGKIIEAILDVMELVHAFLDVHNQVFIHDEEVRGEFDDDVVPVL